LLEDATMVINKSCEPTGLETVPVGLSLERRGL
jgi:hypothetical protein